MTTREGHVVGMFTYHLAILQPAAPHCFVVAMLVAAYTRAVARFVLAALTVIGALEALESAPWQLPVALVPVGCSPVLRLPLMAQRRVVHGGQKSRVWAFASF